MIVYIVSGGSYSDYSIERIFLNKEKAEKYASLYNGYFDKATIEEYKTDDDKEINPIKYIRAWYTVYNKDTNNVKYDFKIITTNDLDNSPEMIKRTSYNDKHYCDEEFISIQRLISELNYDEEKLKNKYEKVCHDLYAQIKYHKSIGWDNNMIQKWLGEQ